MNALILDKVPFSGEYPEKHFGEHFNSILWVKFTDNACQEWVGSFSKVYSDFNKVLTDNATETAFVIAGGQGYLIDINTKELLHETDIPTIESLIHTSNPEYYLLGACYCIYIFDNRKLLKRYDPPFTVDGIWFREQQGQKAIGELYSGQYQQDSNLEFSFDLVTHEITFDKPEEEIKKNEGLISQFLRSLNIKRIN
jgi:hypothetical protein